MKAEHRKELATNALADKLGHLVTNIKQGVSRSTVYVLGAVALVIVLFLIWRYFHLASQERNANLWLTWDQLTAPAEFDRLADQNKGASRDQLALKRLEEFVGEQKNKGTSQGRLAQFDIGRLALYQGLKDLGGFNRSSAIERLKLAASTYEKLITDARDIPVLHQEALLNAGKANEALGDLGKAKGYYEQLKKDYPKIEPVVALADKELKRLEDDSKDGTLDRLIKEYNSPPPSLNPTTP
jgi:tetratricopeptide (TPR) repeat protein